MAGRVVHPAQAEEVLAQGWADAVAMTRALIADPEMPAKAAAGRIDEIRVCTGASEACIGRRIQGKTIACIQNPAIGREAELVAIHPARRSRRVAVAGGGVAGLEAARMAARRGHHVILFEAGDELGGQLRALWRAPARESYREVVRWLADEARRAGVEIRLRTEATPDSLLAEGADAVVVATGARPRALDVPVAAGAHVVSAEDVLLDRAAPGRRVLVVDYQGHMPGPGRGGVSRRPRPRGRGRHPLLQCRGGRRPAPEDERLHALLPEGHRDDPALAWSRRSASAGCGSPTR